MTQVKLSSKNQIVIPREAREKLGLRPGDRLAVSIADGHILLEPAPRDLSRALRGLLNGCYEDDIGRYLDAERTSWDT